MRKICICYRLAARAKAFDTQGMLTVLNGSLVLRGRLSRTTLKETLPNGVLPAQDIISDVEPTGSKPEISVSSQLLAEKLQV